jgi:ATP phosphoribosyltransferase
VVVDENAVKDLVPLVRELGGTGIVTYPVNIAIHD